MSKDICAFVLFCGNFVTLQLEPQPTNKLRFSGKSLSTTMPDRPLILCKPSLPIPVRLDSSFSSLEKNGVGPVSRLPHSLRVVLESVLRNYDGEKITEDDVRDLANWQPNGKRIGRFRSSWRACCCRTLRACRCSSISPRCAPLSRVWEKHRHHRAARAGRSGDRSLGPGRLLQHARCV